MSQDNPDNRKNERGLRPQAHPVDARSHRRRQGKGPWGQARRGLGKVKSLLAPLCLPFDSPLAPFGSLLSPFGLCLTPFCSSLAPFWLPWGSLWLPSAPFGTKPMHYTTLFDTFSLHMAPFGPKTLHCMTFLTLFHFTLPSLRHFCDTPPRNTSQHILHGLKGGYFKAGVGRGVNPSPKVSWGRRGWRDEDKR